ncbi:hypothetical protein KIW84_066282 [Lathyrus oleraceus]|uniref:Uncharacterized protein n=1 Tax=Pisum sativum TaxID=3888 RepID=A0A9D5ABF1_PEA|nr:hypothetical protein KIW84_066282 [Pisum sativum]
MVDVRKVKVAKAAGTEGYTLDEEQATDGLSNDVSFGTSIKGKQAANVEPRTTEGLKGKTTEATEGLRKKFEAISITDDAGLGVNLVDLKQIPPEMEEMEECLKMEQEGMRFGYPKANESLREYLWRCHKKNADMLICPRCSIRISRRVAEDYERWQRTKTERNWRKESQLQKVYPTPGESLLGFIVRCYKYEMECLMCPRCGAVYNRELAEAFERIPYDQGWDGHGGNPNMYSFDKRGAPMRPDIPHPRAKRVMFKLPAEGK